MNMIVDLSSKRFVSQFVRKQCITQTFVLIDIKLIRNNYYNKVFQLLFCNMKCVTLTVVLISYLLKGGGHCCRNV